MTREAIICAACENVLEGATDTFGDVGCPFCWPCYSSLIGEGGMVGERGAYYGLGPHHHDLSITGSLIGSTVFDPLPEPTADGEYIIGNQTFFPDPHAPGLGVWESRPLPGWR